MATRKKRKAKRLRLLSSQTNGQEGHKVERNQKVMGMRKYTVWTDGSCLGNPGYGGWCAIFFNSAFGEDYPTPFKRLVGAEVMTTNNRMEMIGVIEALKYLRPASHIRIVTDSSYVADGATRWYKKWVDRKWKGVANVDLWHILLDEIAYHDVVEFAQIKGHSGIYWNEECDVIAKAAAKELRREDKGECFREAVA